MEQKIQQRVEETKMNLNKLESGIVYLRLSTPQIGNLMTDEEMEEWNEAKSFPEGLRSMNSTLRKLGQICEEFDIHYRELKPYLVEAFPGDYSSATRREEKFYSQLEEK